MYGTINVKKKTLIMCR